ncbi:hypothetical protein [Planotetraspora kaengkrachanensis]|nr:hypothetical protein [Planotetraspora kaengkrachanensis]
MGMFSVVRMPEPLACPKCGESGTWKAQFKFGALDLVEYRVGQRLDWDYAWDVEGERGHHRVVAQGVLEGCPHCHAHGFEEPWDLVVIEIVDDVIVSAVQDTSGEGWWADEWRVLKD